MQTKDAIRATMDISNLVFKSFIEDLDDGELMIRPGPACNHLAWQCGHLIASEAELLESVLPGKSCPLPPGFAEAHSKATSRSDEATMFGSKSQYTTLMEQVRAATLAALHELPDAGLDAPTPDNMRGFCPTVGHVFLLIATHPLMHAGQAVPIRRQLNKPYVFF